MSGHSKWHSIKHKKATADSKKGAVFTRVGRNITLAARDGGGDPESNFKLRMAIDQARAVNMPKDNIDRAVKRGTGEGNESQLIETTYEAYGPAAAAFIVKVVTDNSNRTVSDLRRLLNQHGGSLAESGSVMWNFEQKGVIRLSDRNIDKEKIELTAIDAGAEDIKEESSELTILTNPKNLHPLKLALEKTGVKVEFADIEYIAQNKTRLPEAERKKFDSFIEALENMEDMNDYWTNVE